MYALVCMYMEDGVEIPHRSTIYIIEICLFNISQIEMYRIQIYKTRPEPDVAGYSPAYPAGTGTRTGYCNGCSIALHINCSALMSVI